VSTLVRSLVALGTVNHTRCGESELGDRRGLSPTRTECEASAPHAGTDENNRRPVLGKRTAKVTAATPRNRKLPRGDSGSPLPSFRLAICRKPRERPAEWGWVGLSGSGGTNPAMTFLTRLTELSRRPGERAGWFRQSRPGRHCPSGGSWGTPWGVDHGGADAGYRSDLIRFPEQHFSAAVLCNLADTNPSALTRHVADRVGC
jgi:hypothetical protein